jgi:hypothetical protein
LAGNSVACLEGCVRSRYFHPIRCAEVAYARFGYDAHTRSLIAIASREHQIQIAKVVEVLDVQSVADTLRTFIKTKTPKIEMQRYAPPIGTRRSRKPVGRRIGA